MARMKNSVLVVAAMAFAQAFAHERKETIDGKEKTVVDFKLADGTPVAADQVAEYQLTDADSVAEFNRLFENMPTIKGGYYSYINDAGPTNPTIFKSFSPQGLGKIMAQAVQAAHLIMAKGGAEAETMSGILEAVLGYSAIAKQQITLQKANSLADEIGKLNLSAERRAELLAKLGGNVVPAATVDEETEVEVEA